MKKSLIAVAVAGLFAAPVAMAEVTLSGAINLGIEIGKSSAGTPPGGASLTRTSLASNYSHVDLESVDDIGGGNKVIFHYQLYATPQNATGINDANRNSFLGVAGTWGAFKMGTNENVYERAIERVSGVHEALVHVFVRAHLEGTPAAGNAQEAVAVHVVDARRILRLCDQLIVENDLVAVANVVGRLDVDVRVIGIQLGSGQALGRTASAGLGNFDAEVDSTAQRDFRHRGRGDERARHRQDRKSVM